MSRVVRSVAYARRLRARSCRRALFRPEFVCAPPRPPQLDALAYPLSPRLLQLGI